MLFIYSNVGYKSRGKIYSFEGGAKQLINSNGNPVVNGENRLTKARIISNVYLPHPTATSDMSIRFR